MAKIVRPAYRGPELLLDLVDHCAAILMEDLQIDDPTARRVAVRLAIALAEAWGGQFIWFPRPRPHDRAEEHALNWFELEARDLQIVREHNGRNTAEICERYGISRARLYEIVSRVRVQSRAQVAPTRATRPTPAVPPPRIADLFGSD